MYLGEVPAGRHGRIESEEGWEDYMLSLALFGHLTSVATRPISQGNEIALHDARRAVTALIDQLEAGRHALIPSGH
ncbi:MAG: hypothetical protein P8Y47_12880 [Alphaproteobacteria bacterium]